MDDITDSRVHDSSSSSAGPAAPRTDVAKWDAYYSADSGAPWDSGHAWSVLTGTPAGASLDLAWPQATAAGAAVEIGCGLGHNIPILAGRFSQAIGIDASPVAIVQAQARYGSTPGVQFLRTDGIAWLASQPAGSVPFLCDVQVYHTMPHELRCEYAAAMAHALHPKGRVVLAIGAALRASDATSERAGPPLLQLSDALLPIEAAGLTPVSITVHQFDRTPAYGEHPPPCWVLQLAHPAQALAPLLGHAT